MHIPDGYLGPATFTTLYGLMGPLWAYGLRRLKKTLRAREAPLIALGAALSFAVMMFNVPIPGGSSGHPVGGTLLAIVLGPWAAMLSLTIALAMQALLFGDGGITTFGANAFNLAFILPFAGYGVYKLLSTGDPSARRMAFSAGAAAYAGMILSSVAVGIEFGLQPLLAHDAAGRPMYFPYGLSVSLPAMVLGHLIVFGPIEGIVTGLAISALLRMDPSLIDPETRRGGKSMTIYKLWGALVLLMLLVPLGLWVPRWFGAGPAWGEWSPAQLEKMVGALPSGIRRFGDLWKGWLPEYAIPGSGSHSLWARGWLYLVVGIIGASIVGVLGWRAARLLSERKRDEDRAG